MAETPILKCKKCSKDFAVKPYRQLVAKFCSKSCGVSFNMKGNTYLKGYKWSKETVEKRNNAIRGFKHTEEWKAERSKAMMGNTNGSSEENRKTLSELGKARIGPLNHAWKGGVTPVNEKIRKSQAYKEWRRNVFTRDDYTCQACGQRGGKLHADHELPFALFPDLRFEILNGRALCVPCHQKTPTWGGGTVTFAKLYG